MNEDDNRIFASMSVPISLTCYIQWRPRGSNSSSRVHRATRSLGRGWRWRGGCSGCCASPWYTLSTSSSSLKSEPQLNQESSSAILKKIKPEKYICEACIHVCHNDHVDQLHVYLGGGQYFTYLGGIRSLIGDVARSIKTTMVGGTRCCCNEITNCQLSND